jgi:hypothetical protein
LGDLIDCIDVIEPFAVFPIDLMDGVDAQIAGVSPGLGFAPSAYGYLGGSRS